LPYKDPAQQRAADRRSKARRRPAIREYERARRADDRQLAQARRFSYATGIALDDVLTALRANDGTCDICDVALVYGTSAARTGPCIEHCHETNTIRGIVCHSCNVGLGAFKDDPVRIQRAITYLNARRPDPEQE
jgi:hypothetical protein